MRTAGLFFNISRLLFIAGKCATFLWFNRPCISYRFQDTNDLNAICLITSISSFKFDSDNGIVKILWIIACYADNFWEYGRHESFGIVESVWVGFLYMENSKLFSGLFIVKSKKLILFSFSIPKVNLIFLWILLINPRNLSNCLDEPLNPAITSSTYLYQIPTT